MLDMPSQPLDYLNHMPESLELTLSFLTNSWLIALQIMILKDAMEEAEKDLWTLPKKEVSPHKLLIPSLDLFNHAKYKLATSKLVLIQILPDVVELPML